MRRDGQSRIASISLLMELTTMSLREAKTAVHMSSTWEDVREETDSFHAQLEQAARQQRQDKPSSE
jgi:hypothetical protein